MADSECANQAYQTIKDLISNRHTSRKFEDKEISEDYAFALAQLTPSNNNLQTWRAIVIRGEALQNLKRELQAAWAEGWPVLPPIPDEYLPLKEGFEASFYGKHLGIGRDDHELRNEYLKRNFDFYDATTVVIVYQDNRLVHYDTLSVGFWMQNLSLSLRTKGVEACYMASITGYPTLLKRVLGLPEGVDILSGIALGYINEAAIENTHVMARESWEDRVTFRS